METTSAVPVVVGPGGSGVVAHVGLHGLCAFADRLGLGDELSSAIPRPSERAPLHDRGKVLVHAMAILAGGGEACADIEFLRAEARLFGFVASDSTLWRRFHEITPATRDEVKRAIAGVRAEVWRRSSVTSGAAPVVLDVDASLVEIHNEAKEGTGPPYKGGYGFHPLLVFADATGELLSAMLRPANAGANDIAHHLVVLDGRSPSSPKTSPSGTAKVTTPASSGATSSFAPALRAARPASRLPAAHATSPSRSRPLHPRDHRGDPCDVRARGALGTCNLPGRRAARGCGGDRAHRAR